jgi:hypothetical protein
MVALRLVFKIVDLRPSRNHDGIMLERFNRLAWSSRLLSQGPTLLLNHAAAHFGYPNQVMAALVKE